MAGRPKRRAKKLLTESGAQPANLEPTPLDRARVHAPARARSENPKRFSPTLDAGSGMTPVEQRIEVCRKLIATGAWIPGVTIYSLMKQWGVSLSSVEQYASEASRQLRRDMRKPEERARAIAESIGVFESIRAQMAAQKTPQAAAVAIQAQRERDRYLGIAPAELVDVRHGMLRDEFDRWTDAELDEFGKGGPKPKRLVETNGANGAGESNGANGAGGNGVAHGDEPVH